jgi:hypothetical protein
MFDDDINSLERRIIALSVQRYRKSFFRWGYWLGWAAVSLIVLLFVPALRAYQAWISGAATLLMLTWFFVVATRVIGKLADDRLLADEEGKTSPPSARKGIFRPTLLVMCAIAPLALLGGARASSNPHGEGFLATALAIEGTFCLGIGFAEMLISFAIASTGDYRVTAKRFMELGINLICWAIGLVVLYAMVSPTMQNPPSNLP